MDGIQRKVHRLDRDQMVWPWLDGIEVRSRFLVCTRVVGVGKSREPAVAGLKFGGIHMYRDSRMYGVPFGPNCI